VFGLNRIRKHIKWLIYICTFMVLRYIKNYPHGINIFQNFVIKFMLLRNLATKI